MFVIMVTLHDNMISVFILITYHCPTSPVYCLRVALRITSKMRVNPNKLDVLIVTALGVALRGIMSLGSYSGASTPPMFGDYEAQRHWQEITHNLPAKEWYMNSTKNDLLYWGLDYPPLTAYHSLLMGRVANAINISFVELYTSRGYESAEHKTFMRFTVLAADIFIYIPACLLLVKALGKRLPSHRARLSLLALLIYYPGLILIDNGHFQYNNISLGLMLVAVSAVLSDSYVWTGLFFSLALNYKQMELYHALPFFVILLRVSFSERSFTRKVRKLLQIGLVTLATFAVLWLPWLSYEYLVGLLRRLFPFNRGVFEDKVANIWCSLNIVYKFKENVTNSQMALICLSATVLAILPLNLHSFVKGQKSTFLFNLFNTALAFFLFSFQVHEKSILLAAIPALCLFPLMPFYAIVFSKISVLSMLPLIIKDNICVSYYCMVIAFSLAIRHIFQTDYCKDEKVQKILDYLMDSIDIVVIIFSLAANLIPSPATLPHLWPLIISVLCCGCFLFLLFISVAHQFHFDKYLHRLLYKIVPIITK